MSQPIAPSPRPGDPAPDLALPLAGGEELRLSTSWTGTRSGLVLVFLRHFGCIFCREHVAQLKAEYGQLSARGYDVLAIGHGTPARAAAFARDLALPFPVLGDREQRAYAAYGLGRAGFRSLVDPRLYAAGAKAMLGGARQGKPEGDTRQLPGTFVIDPAGIVQFAKPAAIASDLATTGELLAWMDGRTGAPVATASAAD